jgi:hypothetical protein
MPRVYRTSQPSRHACHTHNVPNFSNIHGPTTFATPREPAAMHCMVKPGYPPSPLPGSPPSPDLAPLVHGSCPAQLTRPTRCRHLSRDLSAAIARPSHLTTLKLSSSPKWCLCPCPIATQPRPPNGLSPSPTLVLPEHDPHRVCPSLSTPGCHRSGRVPPRSPP